MSTPEQDERPPVTTEPQRQALDEMSRELLRKLNAMVEEQNERARQFANTEHSLSSTPMEFNLTLPEPPAADGNTIVSAPLSTTVSGTAAATQPPPHAWQESAGSTPLPPPNPLHSRQNAQQQAAQRRAQILQRQREERRAEQEAEEQRRERIRQAQESADSIGSLLEFLGLKKAKPATEETALPPTPGSSSAESAPQPAPTQSCGCTTLFIVIAVILIILKVIASLA